MHQRHGKITYLGCRKPLDCHNILHVGWCPRRNPACQFWWRSVTGFWRSDGSNFGHFHWLASSSLQHSHYCV